MRQSLPLLMAGGVCAVLLLGTMASQPASAQPDAPWMGAESFAGRPKAPDDIEREPLTWGPLGIRSQGIVKILQLQMQPDGVDVLPAGRWELQRTFTYGNIWHQYRRLDVDGEWSRAAVRFDLGVGHGWEIGVEVPIIARAGGFLDGLIMDVHQWLGITQARRDEYPADRLWVSTYEPDKPPEERETVYMRDGDAGIGFGGLFLYGKARLFPARGGWPGFSLNLGLRLPVGDVAGGYCLPGYDAGAQIMMRWWLLTRWQVFAAFSTMVTTTESVYGAEVRDVQVGWFLGNELRLSRDWALYGQLNVTTGAVHEVALINRPSYEVAVGVKWGVFGPRGPWVAEFALLENLINDANSPDLGFHIGVTYRP